MSCPKALQVGWTIFSAMSALLVSASLIECTGDTNVSIVVTTPGEAVNASSTVLMVCVAYGNPAPSIGWQLRDTTVTNCTSERHTIYEREIETQVNTTFKESILEICSTEPADSGEYLCTANNGISSASATNPTNLTVIPETPSVAIVVTTPSDTVNSGSTVLMVCVAYGSPDSPSINWLFKGATITNSTSCQYTIYERRMKSTQSNFYFTESILEVCDVGAINSGEYLCTASLGEAAANATNATVLTVLSEAPPPPVNCSSVPVYNEEGTLISINFNWAQVDVPEEVTQASTNNLNVTNYTLSLYGSGTHRVPARAVCQNKTVGTCSYSYAVQHSSLPNGGDYSGQVAAENVAGSGKMCSLQRPQTSAQVSVAFLTLSDSTDANSNSKLVECSKPASIGTDQSFNCEFCYNLGQSCDQNSMTCMDVIPGSGSRTLLPQSLAEGTYCYRAAAIVDGSPAKMIRDTFSIRLPCPTPNTATEPSSSVGSSESSVSAILSLPVTTSISAIIALIVGILIGCLFGACSVYMCTRRKKPIELLQLDTIAHNVDAIDTSTKYLTINSAYGSSKDTATGQDVIGVNASTLDGEAPEYEDMDEVRKVLKDTRNNFELSENNAYDRTDDVTESFYDNDAYNVVKTE